MNRAAGLLLAALAAAGPACAASPQVPSFGLLLLAEGGGRDWKAFERDLASRAPKNQPMEIVLGRADVKAVQKSVDRLQARKVKKIVVVPLFLDGNSELMEQTRFLLGIRRDPSLEFLGAKRRPSALIARRVQSQVPLVLAPVLDDQEVLIDVLSSRALELSKGPSRESVVLAGAAAASEKTSERWHEALQGLAQRVRAKGAFQAAAAALLAEDQKQSVRDGYREKFKSLVRQLSRTSRVLVIPVSVTQDDSSRKIPRILQGSFMRFSGKALLPDERISAWVEQAARKASELPDMRTFTDAGRALSLSSTQGDAP